MDGWNRITLVLRPHAAVPPAASDGPGADSDGRDFEVAGPESPGLHESHCSRRKKCREIACSLYKKPPPISIEFSADGFGLTQEWELSKASAAVPNAVLLSTHLAVSSLVDRTPPRSKFSGIVFARLHPVAFIGQIQQQPGYAHAREQVYGAILMNVGCGGRQLSWTAANEARSSRSVLTPIIVPAPSPRQDPSISIRLRAQLGGRQSS